MSRIRLPISTLLFVGTSFFATSAVAATGTWTGGTVTWDTSDTNWSGVSGTPWDSTNGATNDAAFGADGSAPAISGTVFTNGVTFNAAKTVSGGTLTLAGANPFINTAPTFTGTISSLLAGSAGFTKTGTGTLSLGGANTFTGQTIISAGTLQTTNAAALGAGGVGNETIVQSGATLDTGGVAYTNTEIVRIAGAGVGGNGALVNNSAGATSGPTTLVLTGNATIGGAGRWDIRNSAGGTNTSSLDLAGNTLTKVGSNAIWMERTTVTNGNININAGVFGIGTTTAGSLTGSGTIAVGSAGTLAIFGSTAAHVTRDITVANGGTLRNDGSTGGINSNIAVTGTANVDGSQSTTFGGIISGGALNITTGGHVVLSGANTYSGGTTIGQNARVNVSNASGFGTGTVTVQGDGIVNDGQAYISGSITVANAFTISGFGGNTSDTVQRGALRVDNGSTASGAITLSGNAGIGTNSNTGTVSGAVNAAGFTLRKVDGGTTNFTGNLTNVGGIEIGSTALAGGTLSIGGSATINGGTYGGTIAALNGTTASNFTYASSANQTFSGVISNAAAALTLNKTGSGTLTLTGANTYTGVTGITAGTLAAGSNAAFGTSQIRMNGGTIASSDATARTFTSGKSVDFASSSTFGSAGTGNLTFTDSVNIGSAAKTATINNAVTTFAAGIQDSGGVNAFTKAGSGTLIIGAASAATFVRPTTVTAGTLLVNNTTGSGTGTGSVTVNGGVLGGTGAISGVITIASGATLQGGAGAATGTLTTGAGAVTLASGSIIQLALGASGASSQIAFGAGGVSFQTNQAFNFLDLGVTAGSVYTLVTGAGSADTSGWTVTNAGWTGAFQNNAGTVTYALTAVPEPSTYGLLGAGALAAVAFVRRRRKTTT